MNALLVMVHGSPRPEFEPRHVRGGGCRAGDRPVCAGRSRLHGGQRPDIPAAISALVVAGATDVVALPYFLHTGNHVTDDLPGLLEAAQAQYPAVRFAMSDYLGHDPLITEVLRDRIADARR